MCKGLMILLKLFRVVSNKVGHCMKAFTDLQQAFVIWDGNERKFSENSF